FAYPLQEDSDDFWSPYYRVTPYEQTDSLGGVKWNIFVNGIPHQVAQSASSRLVEEPFYDEPYQRIATTPKNVLIVGAGTGSDVAIALTHGVEHVDAVEIDPGLLHFGEDHHPDKPY